MTRQLFKTVVLLFFFNITLFSQVVNSISVTGNTNIPEEDYDKATRFFIKGNFSPLIPDSVNKTISALLLDKGYYNFKINNIDSKITPDSAFVDIILDINEGFKTYIKDFFVQGVSGLDSNYVYENLSFLKESVLDKSEIETVFKDFLDYFENNGHPFSKIVVKSIFAETDSAEEKNFASIYLEFDKQQLSSLDSIEINGNTKTKNYVIIRNLRIQKGEPYIQERLNEIPKRLNRLRYFEPVQTPEYYFDKNNVGILKINVTELETNSFDGVLGYVPASSDKEKGYFTGFVNIGLRNIFGTGRALSVKWQQINRFSQEFDLKYLEPWLFNYPFNINFGMYQKKQDTSYVQRNFSATLDYLATEDISASILISSQSTIPTENEFSKFTVYNSTAIQTGVSFLLDTRDDFYAPREGVYFVSTYKYSRKNITGPTKYLTLNTKTKTELQKYEFDFNYFYEVFNRQIVFVGFHARELRGDLFEVSDLYELGGSNTLRGYRERQFLGNRLLWGNLEFRSLLSRRSFAFLFFDTGYFLRNEDIESGIIKQSANKHGYGFGISLETGLGVLKVSYAIAQGTGFNDGFIHFGIVNEF